MTRHESALKAVENCPVVVTKHPKLTVAPLATVNRPVFVTIHVLVPRAALANPASRLSVGREFKPFSFFKALMEASPVGEAVLVVICALTCTTQVNARGATKKAPKTVATAEGAGLNPTPEPVNSVTAAKSAFTCAASATVPFANVNGTARTDSGISSAKARMNMPSLRGRGWRRHLTATIPSSAPRMRTLQKRSAGTLATCPQTS